MFRELTAMEEMDIDSGVHLMGLLKSSAPWYVGMPQYRVNRILKARNTSNTRISLYKADFEALMDYLTGGV